MTKFIGNSEVTAVLEARVEGPFGEELPGWWNNPVYLHEIKGQTGELPGRTTLVVEDR